ncbi:nucleotide exchange factor GrpE [Parafrankia soli]|uniref:Nucleotide exchange factor GrpE n=1 Tax=Parafrankia soli TaxID=2599596 RepID=A0A1S1PEH3_9ACTN|nr:nucleotide exchange factor GrpE [Parafrankia soli]
MPVEPPGPVESSSASASADREALVGACIELSDRLRDANPALWRRLCRGLAVVGVEAVVVDGQRFDPEAHDAVGREITTDTARHLTVASTEFCGFTDRGRLLRRPEVVVYRMEEAV